MLRGYFLALGVALGGLAAGVALWVSGVDLAVQQAVMAGYHQGFNDVMRVLGELGLGRTQVWGCVLGALAWQMHATGGLGVKGRVFLVGRMVGGVLEQVIIWVKGQVRWASLWQGVRRGPRMLLAAVSVVALAGGAQVLLKMAVGRARPKEVFWNGADPFAVHPFGVDAGYWSFPSGHAVSTWALAVWLGAVFPAWRWGFWSVAVVLAGSRFLAATPHFLGDVVAGSAVGAAVALALVYRMRNAGGMTA